MTDSADSDSVDGELVYDNHGNRAKYLLVEGTDGAEEFWDCAMNDWKLEKPKMIISVIGSGKSLKLSPKVRERFGRGLVRAILSSHAWVLTSGTNVGIAKEVGDAVTKYALGQRGQINLIGFVGWNTLDEDNRENILNNSGKRWRYLTGQEERPLNPTHRYQVFVDHGKKGQFGKEMTYRTKVEHYLRTNPGHEVNIFKVPKYQVPTVCIVVQGGWTALKKAYKSVMEGIPLVLVKGSGGFSDVICETLDLPIDQVTPARVIELMEENDLATKTSCIDDIKKWTRWLVSMLQYNCMFDRKLINVFTFAGNNDHYIDVAILNSLLRLEKSLPVQTYITMCWNRCEVAREILMETDAIDQLKDKDRRILFRNCISMDRVEFMDILFDYDIVNRKFLLDMSGDPNYGKLLEKFYKDTPQTESPFYYLWNLYFGDKPITIARLATFENYVFQMDQYMSCYNDDQMRYQGIETFNLLRDLFLWSLFLGKIEMSFVLFK